MGHGITKHQFKDYHQNRPTEPLALFVNDQALKLISDHFINTQTLVLQIIHVVLL
uniref:Uncharacterized protein n=1 Tax=Rhizophagus irregularis (strain DAOM 181602 / DAOM 197198 / MUCL 43194) TaxID=747089 RepID=U9UQ40_RHIID